MVSRPGARARLLVSRQLMLPLPEGATCKYARVHTVIGRLPHCDGVTELTAGQLYRASGHAGPAAMLPALSKALELTVPR